MRRFAASSRDPPQPKPREQAGRLTQEAFVTRFSIALLCAAGMLSATTAARDGSLAVDTEDPVVQQVPANAVVDWSLIAEDSVVGVRGKPPAPSSINMAMVHIAIYDAVNSIEPSDYPNFAIQPRSAAWGVARRRSGRRRARRAGRNVPVTAGGARRQAGSCAGRDPGWYRED